MHYCCHLTLMFARGTSVFMSHASKQPHAPTKYLEMLQQAAMAAGMLTGAGGLERDSCQCDWATISTQYL